MLSTPLFRKILQVNVFESRKEQLLNSLLKWMVLLGFVAYVPSLIAALYQGLYALALIDSAAYFAVAAIFFSKKASHRLRLISTVFITLLIGAAVLFATGTEGAGHVWLLCSVFIAALFGRKSVTIIAIVLTQLVMISYLVIGALGLINHSFSIIGITAISSNLLLISITLSIITHNLLKSLRLEIDRQEKVLDLLHHRVKNNLQSLESLVSVSAGQAPADSHLSRRVQALSAANELLLSDPLEATVALEELLRVISHPSHIKIVGESSMKIPPERITEIAMGLSDLFEALAPVKPLEIEIHHSLLKIRPKSRISAELLQGVQDENSLIPSGWLELSSTEASDEMLHIDLKS